MGKLFIILLSFLYSAGMHAQAVLFINAGSRASWGTTQELTIDKNGRCSYYVSEVNGHISDSSFFSISQAQVDSLLAKAREAGFFTLNARYDGGGADGAGIYISVNHSGQKHSVSLRNTDLPSINRFIAFVNSVLEPHSIRIYYGQALPDNG